MVEGVNYTFPNETYYDVPRSLVAFRKDHVSKKLIKSWDGSWEDLLRIMDKVKLSKEDIMLAGFPEMDFFEGRVRKQKYMIDDYIVYNIQNKTVHQPFELKEFYEYESFLHKCYQKGYIKNHGMDSCESSEDEIKQMAQGKYAIAWQADERLSASEHVFSRGAVCVQGTLGEGTAVSAYSDKKEKALQLVKILRTDDEVANTLIWGEGDAKKLLDRDGYVKKSVESNRSQATFGINDGIFQKKEDMPPAKNMRKYRDKLRHYSPRTTSRLLGFWPDYSDFYEELLEYQNTLKENMDCFQEKDFEKSYQKAAKRVEKAWRPVEKELQDQIRKWDTDRKK